MSSAARKFYGILLPACLAGYIWLYAGLTHSPAGTGEAEVCLVRYITGIPCPSCGSTRSVISLISGHPLEALNFNPFGLIIALVMLTAPPWILTDLVRKRETLYRAYHWMEKRISRLQYAVPLILLVLANWIWNISKGL